jgi:hypothetical protein
MKLPVLSNCIVSSSVFCLNQKFSKMLRNECLRYESCMTVVKEHTKFRLRHLKGKIFYEDLNEFQMKMVVMICNIYIGRIIH